MALRATLRSIITAVRSEASLSTSTSRGVDHREHIVQLIKRNYETLAEDFDWEHLKLLKDASIARKSMAAGQRVYDFPTAVNLQKITGAWVKWGGVWAKLDYGVGFENYSAYDSDDTDIRADPVRSWQFYGHNQFEIWPIPATTGASEGYQVAFEGQKAIEALTTDDSRLDMDDHLITLMVAAEILNETDPKRAAVKQNAANARLLRTRGNMSGRTRVAFGLGVIGEEPMRPRAPTYVRAS